MEEPVHPLFDLEVWAPALEKFGAASQLSVELYAADGLVVYGPVPTTPLAKLFRREGYTPGVVGDCVRTCLAQPSDHRPPVIVTHASGLTVVGVALALDGQVVAAAVASYTLARPSDSKTLARLARESRLAVQTLRAAARQQSPVPVRRLLVQGELLKVLCDALLRENDLRRHSEHAATRQTHLASHDALTDLPNRVLLADRLTRALALARRYGRRVAVLFVDIDRFKYINDSLGHPLGDELLRVVGHTMTACLRRSDTVGRHGGDEFVIVLSELTHAEDAAMAARKIIAALAQPHRLAGHDLHITVSIGISVFPEDGDDAGTLLTHADRALYRMKDLGRDGYQFFEPDLNERARERQTIEAGLHAALANREFELFYQPKMHLHTGAVVGAEALIRWRHPEHGLIPPARFIPVAEECGLIRPIGRWVVQEACRQAREWQDSGLAPVPIAVNASAVEFRSIDFLPHIVHILAETGLDPRCLELELTESVLMTQVEPAKAVLAALRRLGVQVAIDDFGTGCSSLSYLRHLPVDALKIDQSFVQDVTSGVTTAPMVSAMISMGRNLNLRVIAEGIETADQLNFLQAMHCAEGQGYYWSPPLPARQFADALQGGTRSWTNAT